MLTIFSNIKNRRKELELTQTDLAKKLGYADKSMIAKIEKGNIDLPLSKVFEFADALNISASDLLGWDNSDDLPDSFSLSPEEKDIIIGYRQADEGRREAVRVLLGIETREEKSGASVS